VADLNRDGRLDIAFAHDKNVLVYYQKKNGRFPHAPSETITVQAKTMCVADVNNDQWLDLLCPYYRGAGRRSWYSTVLLGGRKGFSLDRTIKLPTDGGTGSIVSDFNRDGYQDIFFFCHREDGSAETTGKFGDHYTHSRLFWGGSDGFDPENRLEIPSIGVHYDVGVDIGHIKDRSFVHPYTSSSFQCKQKRPVRISWEAETPHRTSVKFQIRSARSEKALARAAWKGSDGANIFFTRSGSSIPGISENRWIQYRVFLDTDNGANSPILNSVEITLE